MMRNLFLTDARHFIENWKKYTFYLHGCVKVNMSREFNCKPKIKFILI